MLHQKSYKKKYNAVTALAVGAFLLTMNSSNVFADPVITVDGQSTTCTTGGSGGYQYNDVHNTKEVLRITPSADVKDVHISFAGSAEEVKEGIEVFGVEEGKANVLGIGVEILADGRDSAKRNLEVVSDANITLDLHNESGEGIAAGIFVPVGESVADDSHILVENKGRILAKESLSSSPNHNVGMVVERQDSTGENLAVVMRNSGTIDVSTDQEALGMWSEGVGHAGDILTLNNAADGKIIVSDSDSIAMGSGAPYVSPLGDQHDRDSIDSEEPVIGITMLNKGTISVVHGGVITGTHAGKKLDGHHTRGMRGTGGNFIVNSGSILGGEDTIVTAIDGNGEGSTTINSGVIDLKGNYSVGMMSDPYTHTENRGTITVSQSVDDVDHSPSSAMKSVYYPAAGEEMSDPALDMALNTGTGTIKLGGGAIGFELVSRDAFEDQEDAPVHMTDALGINLGEISSFSPLVGEDPAPAKSFRVTGGGAVGVNAADLADKVQLREGGNFLLIGNPEGAEKTIARIQVRDPGDATYEGHSANSWIHVGMDAEDKKALAGSKFNEIRGYLNSPANFAIKRIQLQGNAVESEHDNQHAHLSVADGATVSVGKFDLTNAHIVTQDSSQAKISNLNLYGQNKISVRDTSHLTVETVTAPYHTNSAIEVEKGAVLTTSYDLLATGSSIADTSEFSFAGQGTIDLVSSDVYDQERITSFETSFKSQYSDFKGSFLYSGFDMGDGPIDLGLAEIIDSPEKEIKLTVPEDSVDKTQISFAKGTPMGAQSYELPDTVAEVKVSKGTVLSLRGSSSGEESLLKGGAEEKSVNVGGGSVLNLGAKGEVATEKRTQGTLDAKVELVAADDSSAPKTELNVRNGDFSITALTAQSGTTVNIGDSQGQGQGSLALETASLGGKVNIKKGTLSVKELTATEETVINIGNSQGQGSLALETASLNGAMLFADPNWLDSTELAKAKDASHVSIVNFGTGADSNVINGHLVAGQNSIIALGTTDAGDVDNIVKKITEDNNTTWGRTGVTAAVYLDGPYKVGAAGSLTVDGSRVTAPTGADVPVGGTATFADNSLLVVDVTNLAGQPAITADTVTISNKAFVGVKGALVGEKYTMTSTGDNWLLANIYLYNQLQEVASLVDGSFTTKSAGTAATLYGARGNTASFLTNYNERGYEVLGVTSTNYMKGILRGASPTSGGQATEASANIAGVGGIAHVNTIASALVLDLAQKHTDITGDYSTGIYFQPLYQKSDISGMNIGNYSTDMDIDLYGAALGADSVLGDFLYGGAFTYGAGKVSGEGFTSSADTDSDFYGLTMYGAYNLSNAMQISVDALYTAMSSDTRYSTLKADGIDSYVLGTGVKASYLFELGDTVVSPYAGMRYQYYKQDAYTNDVFAVNASSMDTWIIPMGVKYMYKFAAADSGLQFNIAADAGVNFAFGDTDFTSRSTLIGTPETLPLITDVYDDVTGKLSVDLIAERGQLFGSFGVNTAISSHISSLGANLKFGFRF
ncbi:autotransporter family protein [Desulfotalea psychrophila]|uniref:Autotransporter domain-containing protein n=1 Tax=Desulfotalea psychrophila (strain LSv54 / DSM 12343) TaxID=177439 RepID=Q6ALB9_DESPS|nr:autotransporter outer membrane beta-barrel domain-containing protein [Desulfotalea psychrophila]CAG36856.1 unknown protein [Desulfotalea psychrophila LSv54]